MGTPTPTPTPAPRQWKVFRDENTYSGHGSSKDIDTDKTAKVMSTVDECKQFCLDTSAETGCNCVVYMTSGDGNYRQGSAGVRPNAQHGQGLRAIHAHECVRAPARPPAGGYERSGQSKDGSRGATHERRRYPFNILKMLSAENATTPSPSTSTLPMVSNIWMPNSGNSTLGSKLVTTAAFLTMLTLMNGETKCTAVRSKISLTRITSTFRCKCTNDSYLSKAYQDANRKIYCIWNALH